MYWWKERIGIGSVCIETKSGGTAGYEIIPSRNDLIRKVLKNGRVFVYLRAGIIDTPKACMVVLQHSRAVEWYIDRKCIRDLWLSMIDVFARHFLNEISVAKRFETVKHFVKKSAKIVRQVGDIPQKIIWDASAWLFLTLMFRWHIKWF